MREGFPRRMKGMERDRVGVCKDIVVDGVSICVGKKRIYRLLCTLEAVIVSMKLILAKVWECRCCCREI
jgi:hypothetical protein